VLADSVSAAAYRIAVRKAPPPANPAYQPFGPDAGDRTRRLGMREFDLGSDADLNFVIPDGIRRAVTGPAWRSASSARFGSYTGEGIMFVIDTPPPAQRPRGRPGADGGGL